MNSLTSALHLGHIWNKGKRRDGRTKDLGKKENAVREMGKCV